MASTINASTAGGGGIISTADSSGVLTLQTGGVNGLSIDANQFATGTVKGNSAGLYQASQYYRLESAYTGTQSTSAQSLFGVGVTLTSSTVYEMEYWVLLSKSAGTTSHTVGLLFGGTATYNNAAISVFPGGYANGTTTSAVSVTTAPATGFPTLIGPLTSATQYVVLVVKGTISVNAGGTFIPQYILSAAPGGAYSTVAGSYVKISPISASGSNTNVGSWA